nr:alpha-L-glutamate ligase-like protein [Oceanobacter mangrovi]
MLIAPAVLGRNGVLGMNARNRLYISRYNNRAFYPLVDNKLKTKRLAEQFDIPVPELIDVIESQHQVADLQRYLQLLNSFVIKPSKGSGGKGILVLQGRDGDHWIKSSGALVSLQEIQRHVSNILAGLYSLGGTPDVAIIEHCIQFDQSLVGFSHEGVPDIRVIVCRGYPVMAMTRLATHSSDGKANLHQGAVGVGISLLTGKAIFGVMQGQRVKIHPDTGEDLARLQIPHWQTVLELAARCYDVTGLGYLGTDVVIDAERGPMLLELNARPGLAIQMANGQGLLPRLRKIDQLSHAEIRKPVAERVRLSQQWFAD